MNRRRFLWLASAAALVGALAAGGACSPSWSTQTLAPAESRNGLVGHGLRTMRYSDGGLGFVSLGVVAHPGLAPDGSPRDSVWFTEAPDGLRFCLAAAEGPRCGPARFEGGPPPDLPRMVDNGALGRFWLPGLAGVAHYMFAPGPPSAVGLPYPRRGIWVTATSALYRCQLADDGAADCARVSLGGAPVRPWLILALHDLRTPAGYESVLWFLDDERVGRCAVGADGALRCVNPAPDGGRAGGAEG